MLVTSFIIFSSVADCQISDLLWTCLNLFSASRYKLATKTLILFPWRDDPHFGMSSIYLALFVYAI